MFALMAMLLIRTLVTRSAQIVVDPISKIEIDESALSRFAAAIRLPTVSRVEAPESDFSAFDALRRHIADRNAHGPRAA